MRSVWLSSNVYRVVKVLSPYSMLTIITGFEGHCGVVGYVAASHVVAIPKVVAGCNWWQNMPFNSCPQRGIQVSFIANYNAI